MTQTTKVITRTVWLLSLVSLFTDTASEMLYPIMPAYLKSIGFSVLFIGVLEGIAEATAGLSKGYFGKLSDHMGRRLPFVQFGYGISALSKPLMALFTAPLWIFFSRTLDRLGKGVRTGARDALLSAEATPQTKATVFGFHRSMDTLGAVLGPLAALVWLAVYPGSYRTLLLLAFFPGVLAVFSALLLREAPSTPKAGPRPPFLLFIGYFGASPIAYKKLVVGLLAFTLFNSSDVFLLLKARDAGLSDTVVLGIYIAYNLVYALCAYPLGIIADRLGLKKILVLGLVVFGAVYIGMGWAHNWYQVGGLFLLYGVYAAATEGVSKAWITNLIPKSEAGTAIGAYSALQSLCTLLASVMAGFIWYRFGAAATFMVSGVGVLVVAAYLAKLRVRTSDQQAV